MYISEGKNKSPRIWTVSFGGMGGDRTHDKRLKRPLLYRLSYHPVCVIFDILQHFAYFIKGLIKSSLIHFEVIN